MPHNNKIFIPPSDYHLSDFLAAALRYGGFKAAALPPSDDDTRKTRDKYVFGQECRPLQIIVGDVMKWLTGGEVNLKESLLLMPSFSGCDCSFGMYGPNLRAIAVQNGFADLKLFAPDLGRQEELLDLLGMDVVQVLWRAVLTAELLAQMLLLTRPQSEDKEGVAAVCIKAVREIEAVLAEKQVLPAQLDRLARILENAGQNFAVLSSNHAGELSLIGMVGEPYNRYSAILNNNLIKNLENSGGRIWLKPLTDELMALLNPLLAEAFGRDAAALEKVCEAFFNTMGLSAPFPARQELISKGHQYVPDDTQLDGISLNLGWFMHMAENGAAGIASLWSVSCPRVLTEQGFYNHFRENYDDIPLWLFHCSGIEHDYSETVKIFFGDIQKYQVRRGFCASK